MSEIKELKVGDVVSNNDGFGWTSRLLKTKSDLWAFLSNVVEVGDDWQHGLHESLIPEGFAIVPIDNWINCGDRLPDTDDEYLVAFTASHMDNLEAVRSDNFIKRLGKFFIHGGTVNVHHWKPLPQPPKPTDK